MSQGADGTGSSDAIDMAGWRLESGYASLPESLFASAETAGFPSPELVVVNEALSKELGLDFGRCTDGELARLFTGQRLPDGARPIAQAYAGHQYGHFTMLGDGRAMLLGEQRTPDGRRMDIHFKGTGETAFSRRGDGRAALGPMLREYIVSEAMHALGIPTTRSLAVATTGETIERTGSRRGAVLTRVASSHVRVGTFQYAAGLDDPTVLRALADHAIARHDEGLVDATDRHAAFLRAVIARQAELVARWQCVGFVHGVLNTDNTLVSGETIDYGPCAFLDGYHPDTVFSSIDHHGRYRFAHQPAIIQWNLARFAEALVPLLSADETTAVALANEALDGFAPLYRSHWLSGMKAKLGMEGEAPDDLELVRDLLSAMAERRADFTTTFRALSEGREPEGLGDWLPRWRERLGGGRSAPEDTLRRMRAVNPAVLPRNHRVEEVLASAECGDLGPFHDFVAALRRPFDPEPGHAVYTEPPPPDFTGYCTFCGT